MLHSSRSRRRGPPVPQVQVVVFRIADDTFAFPVESVERVLRHRTPTAVPDCPDWIRGMLAFENRTIPVVDMRRRLSLPSERPRFQTRIVVVTTSEGPIGAQVDAVLEVASLPVPEIQPPPPLMRGLAAEFLRGIIHRGGEPLVILEPERVLTSEVRIALDQALAAQETAGA